MAGTPLRVAIEGDDKSRDAFRSLDKNLKKTSKVSKGLLSTFSKLTVVAFGVNKAFKAVTGGFGNLLSAAENQINAEIGLAAALAQTTNEVGKALADFKKFASARQEITTFGDEATIALGKVGAEFGLQGKLLQDVVAAVQDRATALGRGPIEVMRVIARFATGVGDSLIDIGIVVDKTKPRLEELQKAVKAMRSGLSEAIGSLPTSGFTQLTNAFGDLSESLGIIITSTATFQSILKGVKGLVNDFNAAIQGDPKKVRQIADAIDGFVKGVISAMFTVVAAIADALAAVLRFIEKTLNFVVKGVAQAISKLLDLFTRFILVIQDFFLLTQAQSNALVSLAFEIQKTSLSFFKYSSSIKIGSESISNFGDATRKARDFIIGLIDSVILARNTVPEAMKAIFKSLKRQRFGKEEPEDGGGGPSAEDEAKLAQLQERQAAFAAILIADLEGIGGEFTSTFTTAVQEAFDKDTGIRQAFKNLGDNVRTTFIGQFSDAAFKPLKLQFGVLAKALAQPFEIVGNVIASILAPITSLIAKAISFLITQFLTVIGLQELAAATGLSGLVAISAGAAGLASVWGAAAIAATIATLGGALASVPAAITAISTGAGITKALAAPGLAEGGIVLPRPGGLTARIGEAGRAEAVIPLDDERAAEQLGALGGVTVSFEGANVSLTPDTAQDTITELGREFQLQVFDARNFGRGGFAGLGRAV